MTSKPVHERFQFTYEWLHDHYITQDLTPREIGEKIGYTGREIQTKLHKFGIAAKRRAKGGELPGGWLYDRYVGDRWTIHRIAQATGWCAASVYQELLKQEIPIRTKKRVPDDPVWLYQHYWEYNRNCPEIAAELGCNPTSVEKALRKHGIPIKPRELCWRDKRKRMGDFTPSQRKVITLRDGSSCRWPGCGATLQLECHHIVPTRYGGKNVPENGLTLCAICHEKLRFHELDYIEFLLPLRGTGS